jgi:NADH:ubiquinone oxidoreductase subunit E
MEYSPEVVVIADPLNVPEQRAIIDQILNDNKDLAGAPIVVLNEIQTHIGYISNPMQAYIAEKLGTSQHHIHGVVTFYSFFATEPKGKNTIKFCRGTACYVGGANRLIDQARQALGIDIGETTPDGQITLEECRCLGACSQAPVIVLNEDLFGRAQPKTLIDLYERCQETG